MEIRLDVHVSFQMVGHTTLYAADVAFYRSLPNYTETARDAGSAGSDRIVVPRPNMWDFLQFTGGAVLSSTVLATAIKAWLQSHKTKITVTETKSMTKITYEGPG